jgi:hypothetical protein
MEMFLLYNAMQRNDYEKKIVAMSCHFMGFPFKKNCFSYVRNFLTLIVRSFKKRTIT